MNKLLCASIMGFLLCAGTATAADWFVLSNNGEGVPPTNCAVLDTVLPNFPTKISTKPTVKEACQDAKQRKVAADALEAKKCPEYELKTIKRCKDAGIPLPVADAK